MVFDLCDGGKRMLEPITPTLGQHVVPGLTFPYRLILIHRIKKSVSLVWLGRP